MVVWLSALHYLPEPIPSQLEYHTLILAHRSMKSTTALSQLDRKLLSTCPWGYASIKSTNCG